MDVSVELHQAFEEGEVDRIRALLGQPLDFPNTPGIEGFGSSLLVYAIYWSPLSAIEALLRLGADVTAEVDAGFPPLIAATDRRPFNGRDDRLEVISLLLRYGADPNVRGVNDGTVLHQLVWKREGWPQHLDAAGLLLAHGANPTLRTRIDDYRSATEDAEASGAAELARLLRAGQQSGQGVRPGRQQD